jgi:hypothetical protein
MSMNIHRRRAPSFLDSIREFLTPAVWKQAEQARHRSRRWPRWSSQPLVLTLLVLTWCWGDSQAERFEIAKGFTAVCLSKRRRPGKTVQGFEKALAKLPMTVLRAVARGVRQRLRTLLHLTGDGWTVLGVDGTALQCPRAAELEQRLDPPPQPHGPPQVWVTALVHLRTGVLWAWRVGQGHNRERRHLRALLATLPPDALVVADAGYTGYELAQTLVAAGVSFLIRASAKDRLYTEQPPWGGRRRQFDGEQLWCWPQQARKALLPPLRVRLIRLRDRKRRQPVWLLTNVLDANRLSHRQASLYYRWRWENEGFFRTYKRTLAKVKLLSRTVRLAHREVEGALLATQLLLAQGARALVVRNAHRQKRTQPRCSPRRVLLTLRSVILGRIGVRQRGPFRQRLAQALREQRRRRRSLKVRRVWPGRTDYDKALKPPIILTLTRDEKVLLAQLLKQPA